MKKSSTLRGILLAGLCSSLCLSSAHAEKLRNAFRIWKSNDGQEMTARMLGVRQEGKRTFIILGTQDNKQHPIPLERLSQADRDWAKKFHLQQSQLSSGASEFKHTRPRLWHPQDIKPLTATLVKVDKDKVTLRKNGKDWSTSALAFSNLDYSYLKFHSRPSLVKQLELAKSTKHKVTPIKAAAKLKNYQSTSPSRIEVSPSTGTVNVYLDGQVVKTTHAQDADYQKAVSSNKLHEWIGDPRAKTRIDGSLDLPISVINYPMLGQQGATCWEAYFREWVAAFGGQERLTDSALSSLENWITATKLGLWKVTDEDVTRLTGPAPQRNPRAHGLNSAAFNAGLNTIHWIEAFLDMEVNYYHYKKGKSDSTDFINTLKLLPHADNKLTLEQHLLLGHGVLVVTDRGKNNHICSLLESTPTQHTVSSWKYAYPLESSSKKLGKLTQHAVIIKPKRNAQGACEFLRK